MKVIERKKPLWAFVFGQGDDGKEGLISCVKDATADTAGSTQARVEFNNEDGSMAVVHAFGQTQTLSRGYAWLSAPGYSLVIPLDNLEQEWQDAEKDRGEGDAGADPGIGSRVATLETQVRILQAAVETMRAGKGSKGGKASSTADSSEEAASTGSAPDAAVEPVPGNGTEDNKEGGA